MAVKTLRTVELKPSVYSDFSSREFPLCDLLERFGSAFKFKAPGHELHDAKNINHLHSELASIDSTAFEDKAVIRLFKYQKLKTDDDTIVCTISLNIIFDCRPYRICLLQVYRASTIRAVKTVNIKSYLTTAQKMTAHELDPSNIADIDKLFQLISKKSIIYIHNIGLESNYHLDGNVFHNPAAIRNPLGLLKENNPPPEISRHWFYVGKRYTNSFLHTDDFGLPVLNTMLNEGRKFWMVIDPVDNCKLIDKLRAISSK